MAWRPTPEPYDHTLLAEVPPQQTGVPTNYDVGLLNAGAQVEATAQAQAPGPSPPQTSNLNTDSANSKEANEAGAPMLQSPVVPFWRIKAGLITIGVIVGMILIIALSLGATAEAAVRRDHRPNAATLIPTLNETAKSTSLKSSASMSPTSSSNSSLLSSTSTSSTSSSLASGSISTSSTSATSTTATSSSTDTV